MIEEKDVNSTAKIEAFIKEQGYSIRSSTINKRPEPWAISERYDTAITVTIEFERKIMDSRLMSEGCPVEEKPRIKESKKVR